MVRGQGVGGGCDPVLPLPGGTHMCPWPGSENNLHLGIPWARPSPQNVTEGALLGPGMMTHPGGFQKQRLGVFTDHLVLNCTCISSLSPSDLPGRTAWWPGMVWLPGPPNPGAAETVSASPAAAPATWHPQAAWRSRVGDTGPEREGALILGPSKPPQLPLHPPQLPFISDALWGSVFRRSLSFHSGSEERQLG